MTRALASSRGVFFQLTKLNHFPSKMKIEVKQIRPNSSPTLRPNNPPTLPVCLSWGRPEVISTKKRWLRRLEIIYVTRRRYQPARKQLTCVLKHEGWTPGRTRLKIQARDCPQDSSVLPRSASLHTRPTSRRTMAMLFHKHLDTGSWKGCMQHMNSCKFVTMCRVSAGSLSTDHGVVGTSSIRIRRPAS